MLGENLLPYIMGGAMAGFFFASLMLLFLLLAAVYVYSAYAWMLIAKRLKYDKPWLAWIPFANVSMIFQLGGFHWALVFLLLIPIFGWIAVFVLSIISHWRIFEKRKYPGWYSLSVIVPYVGSILYLIAIGLVAWKDKKK
ncbi:MAG: hypothetical protein AABX70_08790 [Nanoarchaeota archaeon]